jgi:hypothetical protein
MWLSSQVRRRRCAICWGPVVLKYVEGEWVVVCPKGCQPGGHVSEDYVEYRRQRDTMDYMIAAANYPELAPKPDPEMLKAGRKALFGED